MNRTVVREILTAHQDELQRLGVRSLALFGSTARGDAGPGSDIDLLIDLSRPMGAFALLDIKSYIEEILGHSVDLVTAQALKPRIRAHVQGDLVAIFGPPPAA